MQKWRGKLYIVQDLLQDGKTNGVVEYARNSAENAKDMLDCSDSVYLCNQPAYADRNHAPSLSCVPLEK